jgi:hypothetical protein
MNEEKIDKENKTLFWVQDPNILLAQGHIFELFPVEKMSFNEKLNAITRLIILLTIIGFLYSKSIRLLIICCIILFCIYLLYNYENRKLIKKEGYRDVANDIHNKNDISQNIFKEPSINNPLGNVLITDYEDNPQRLPAPPAEDVEKKILEKTKQMVINSNLGQPDISSKLFSDLGDNFNFEQSMRPFYSNPNTEIPNDQETFAAFCYGNMTSCKEGNNFACARNLQRYTN